MIDSFLRNLDSHSIIHENMFDDDAHVIHDDTFHHCSCGHDLRKDEVIYIGKQEMGRRNPGKFLKLYNCPYCFTTFTKK